MDRRAFLASLAALMLPVPEMTPGPKPKPAALRLIDGTRAHSKSRGPEDQPEPVIDEELLTNLPATLTKCQRDIWLETVQNTPPALLCKVDRPSLISYVVAVDLLEQANKELQKGLVVTTAKGYVVPSPYISIANKAMEKILRFGEQFGFSPASRTRISVSGNKKASNPFEKHKPPKK